MGAREYGSDLLRRLLELAMDFIPGSVGAGVGLTGRPMAGLGVAGPLDAVQWAVDVGPLPDAVAGGGTLALPALPTAEGGPDPTARLDWSRWPALAERLARGPAGEGPDRQDAGPGRPDGIDVDGIDREPPGGVDRRALDGIDRQAPDGIDRETLDGVRGVVVTPGEWGADAPVIFSVYLDRPPDAEILERVDRLEPLMAEALAVVEYCAGEELRAQQMLQMVQYRRVIEQAKGMIMAALGQDAPTAFAALARASQHFNVRLRHLAVALVEHVGTAPAEAPDDPEQVVRPTDADRAVAAQVWAALNADGPHGVRTR